MRYLFIVLIACVKLSFAQVPQAIGFQMVVRDNAGKLIAKKVVGVRISILQGNINGSAVYQETFSRNTNSNGFLFFPVGQGTVVSGSFAAINWANGPFFIKSEIDPAGGANYNIIGTTQLLSVPYAFTAAHATYDSLYNLPALVSQNQQDSLQELMQKVLRYKGLSDSVVLDFDGNPYNVVKIGEQYWLKENLRTTHFHDGNKIVVENNKKIPAKYLNSFSTSNINDAPFKQGVFYNHATAISNNVCPIGFHVPSDSDFVQLTNFLGGLSVAGGKMKLTTVGSNFWLASNVGATNSSGFSAIGSGIVNGGTIPGVNGVGTGIGSFTTFWTTSPSAKVYMLSNNSAAVQTFNTNPSNGANIRCIRD
jgi:uncharacterized protein (TIGR02145 family)